LNVNVDKIAHTTYVEGESNSFHEKIELPLSILLVEDDKAHAQLIGRALKGVATNVIHVEDLHSALELIATEAVDLVLTDLNLVSSTGFELISLLKNEMPHLPVVVLTSSSNLDDAVRAMREGAWDYLSKHFTSTFPSHLELVLSRTWERACQKRRESEAQLERDAFWMASSLAEDGLAILDSGGSLLYHNNSFNRFTEVLKSGGKLSNLPDNQLITMIAPYDFLLSQELFSQIHINDDSLWRSQLHFQALGASSDINIDYYYELRLSTVHSFAGEAIIKDLVDIKDRSKVSSRYHILWVKDVTQVKNSEELERNILATTTHDLKGPLGAIITSTEMILEDLREPDVNDLVVRIASCARTSLNLVDQLLSARKLQDGLMGINPDWLDLKDIAEDVFHDLSPVAKSKGVSFSFLKPESSVPLFADSLALQRILGNLISNAIKFTQKGGEVVLEVEKTKGGAVLRVSDNGKGIDPEKQSTLFEMFGRLPEHSKVDGTGLGLFITKKLVDMHKAVLELKSSVGQGSTFSVRFKNPDEVQNGRIE